MKHIRCLLPLVKSFLPVVFYLTAFNQISNAGGGDSYQIYLNKKLVLTQYVNNVSTGIMTLQLDKSNYNDQLVIVYSHCGVTGKGRNIVVKNDQNQVLKEWKYADVEGSDASMIIPVKDILELKKNNTGSTLNLYYFASELLPGGRMLTSLRLDDKSVTLNEAGLKSRAALL